MKTNALIVILIALVLIVGCKGGGSKTPEKSPFIGGTNGLIIGFLNNFPPAEVFDGGEDSFDIVVNLKNDGEFDIPAGELLVSLSGIQASEFGKSPGDMSKSLSVVLDGKKKSSEGDIVPGGEESIEFTGFNHVQPLTGTMTFPLRADVSYLYGTTATSKLCFKKHLRASDNGVCKIEEQKEVYNSAAPVQVSELNEYIKGNNAIGFRFKISLLGNGQVCKFTQRNCFMANRLDRNTVYVEVQTNEPGLVCRGLRDGSNTAGYARLSDGSAIIQCEQPINNVVSDFEKPANIFLKYRYTDDISTTLVVKHAQ